MHTFIKGTDINKCIEAPRIRWRGPRIRMEDVKLVKMITGWNPIRIRPEGRNDKWFKDRNWEIGAKLWKKEKPGNGVVKRPKPMLGCSVRRKRRCAVILIVSMTIQ